MANLNVIDNPASGNFQYNHYYAGHRPNHHLHVVRESEPDYTNDYGANTDSTFIDTNIGFNNSEPAINAAKLQSLWPQFPDGAYLNAAEAAHLYRTTQAISGLVFALNRSTYQRGLVDDYINALKPSLSEAQESKLWSALIALSTDLIKLTDDLQNRSEENTHQ
jgi:hypothetical protein